jgi:hypothetical protein
MNSYAKNRHIYEDLDRSKHYYLHAQFPQRNGRKVHGSVWKVASGLLRIRRLFGATKRAEMMWDPLVNPEKDNMVMATPYGTRSNLRAVPAASRILAFLGHK